MIDLVANKRAEIEALCEEHSIRKLSLFGSAATGRWNPETSDLDFLIDLGSYDDRVARRLMEFLAGLERLFGDRFDAITERSIHSVKFREEVSRTAITLYEQSNHPQAA